MPRQPLHVTKALRERLFDIVGGFCEWPGCHEPAKEMAHFVGKGMGGRSRRYGLDEVFALCVLHHRCQDGEGGETINGISRREEVYVLYCELDPMTFPGDLLRAIDEYVSPDRLPAPIPKLKAAISTALHRYAVASRVGVVDG